MRQPVSTMHPHGNTPSPWRQAAPHLRRLGVQALPIPAQAKGPGGTGITFRGRNKAGSKPYTAREHADMERHLVRRGQDGATIGTYILAAPSGLLIVDVDGPEYLQWALDTFPPTPLSVSRSGRIRHLYYRIEPGAHGHRLGLLGPRSVDLIATTGIVGPGSIHADGEVYEPTIPWPEIEDLSILPELPDRWLNHLLHETERYRPSRQPIHDIAPPGADAGRGKGWVHFPEPEERPSGYAFAGYVYPETPVRTLDGEWIEIRKAKTGVRCFASYRDDTTPSSAVTDAGGSRFFFDYSRSLYWRMLAPANGELPADESLAWACEKRLGIEQESLPSDGWIDIPPIPEDTTVFLLAPHGTGKTVYARSEHARAESSVSVTNTRALTHANAEVLGLSVVHDKPQRKGSVCIPSLTRYTDPPEFFHVDEADAVHQYLHSGNVEDAETVFDRLMTFCAKSSRCLIASADLTFADIALYAKCIRARNPGRRLKIYTRDAKTHLVLRLTTLAQAKAAMHRSIMGGDRVYVACSARKMPGAIAQGYSTSAREVNAVSMSDVLDPPVPQTIEGPEGIGHGQAWTVSADNSRYHATVRDLRDPNAIMRRHRLVTASPAIQSGVSITERVDRVFAIHTNRDLPAPAMIQMIRRARYPRDRVIVAGVPRWKPKVYDLSDHYLEIVARTRVDLDSAYLEMLRARVQDREPTGEFLDSWKIYVKRVLRSRMDPIGEIVREARRNGIEVQIDMPEESERCKDFGLRVKIGSTYRRERNAEDVARARTIERDERDKIQRAAQLADGDRTAAVHYDLRRFYEREVTPKLVLLDNDGRFRAACRAWAHLTLAAEGRLDVVALVDAQGDAAPMIARHHATLAHLRLGLWRSVLRVSVRPETIKVPVARIRTRTRAWVDEYQGQWLAVRDGHTVPSLGQETRWFCAQMRRLGAVIDNEGKTDKAISFARVAEYAEPYRLRCIAAFERFGQAREGAGDLPVNARGIVDVGALAAQIKRREKTA